MARMTRGAATIDTAATPATATRPASKMCFRMELSKQVLQQWVRETGGRGGMLRRKMAPERGGNGRERLVRLANPACGG
jgi:hypothetical protein